MGFKRMIEREKIEFDLEFQLREKLLGLTDTIGDGVHIEFETGTESASIKLSLKKVNKEAFNYALTLFDSNNKMKLLEGLTNLINDFTPNGLETYYNKDVTYEVAQKINAMFFEHAKEFEERYKRNFKLELVRRLGLMG